MRIGIGYDSHTFSEGKTLVVGGVHIPYRWGFLLIGRDVLCLRSWMPFWRLGEGTSENFFRTLILNGKMR